MLLWSPIVILHGLASYQLLESGCSPLLKGTLKVSDTWISLDIPIGTHLSSQLLVIKLLFLGMLVHFQQMPLLENNINLLQSIYAVNSRSCHLTELTILKEKKRKNLTFTLKCSGINNDIWGQRCRKKVHSPGKRRKKEADLCTITLC